MGVEVDPKFEIPFSRKLYFKMHCNDVSNRLRYLERKLGGVPSYENKLEDLPAFEEMFAFEPGKIVTQYSEKGWVFVENFFKESFHEALLRDWPRRKYRMAPRKPTKWYETGFTWVAPSNPPEFLEAHPAFSSLFHTFLTDDFLNFIERLTGIRQNFGNFFLTDCGQGAEVPIHLDSTDEMGNTEGAIGIAIFYDGTGGTESGGLAISGSPKWDDVIFEPTNLRNSALFYDKQFHHGFKPLRKGSFRKSTNTAFYPISTL